MNIMNFTAAVFPWALHNLFVFHVILKIFVSLSSRINAYIYTQDVVIHTYAFVLLNIYIYIHTFCTYSYSVYT